MAKINRTPPGKQSLPPYSGSAESSALGCILCQAANGQKDDSVAMLQRLCKEDFYEEHHREIYCALQRLQIDGRVLDIQNLRQWLLDKEKLQDAGGIEYLAKLPDSATPAAFDNYLSTLKDKASRREAIRLAAEVERLARDEAQDLAVLAVRIAELTGNAKCSASGSREWIRFYSPSECRNYTPPTGHVLVGDCHIMRGAVTVIGGAPGVGKSRAAIALAVAGAIEEPWYGLKVHRRFKTLIVQNENGRFRLKKDFVDITGEDLDGYIRVSEPPANGMAFEKVQFRAALARILEDFKPDLVILDPWNSVARDDKQRDYLEAFEAIREVLPPGDDAPALLIVAHTRKPRVEERASGRALLNLLAGSYVLGSVPRSAFVMVSASDDTTDDRVVWTCCKNNDGELGARSACRRRNGAFLPCDDFDWNTFDRDGEKRRAVSLEDMDALFCGGKRKLALKVAAKELEARTDFGHSACYEALKTDGRFKEHLAKDENGLLSWTP